MIKLSNSIKVFVPVTNNDGAKVDFTSEITAVIGAVGGATTYPATGSWLDGGKLYTDNIKVVQFNAVELDSKAILSIDSLVRAIFIKAEQLAASVEVNGVLYTLESVDDIEKLF